MKPAVIPPGAGHSINVLGTPMLIRIHGRDTNGTVSAVETVDSPGGGPPPHIHHREDETFQVLEGEYEFMVAGSTVRAEAGTTLFAPRDVPHTYRCVGDKPGRLLCIINPAGFEQFFETIGAMSPSEQQNIPKVIEIGRTFGLEFLPPPSR